MHCSTEGGPAGNSTDSLKSKASLKAKRDPTSDGVRMEILLPPNGLEMCLMS
jgi:hypothetical protein